MLVKYWQAALLAAMMALAGNAARAQEFQSIDYQTYEQCFLSGYCGSCCKQEKCCDAKDCCKDGACCKKKDGCKDCSCCKDKEDCKNCACGKGKDCCKSCECCKGKDCSCCKDKDCCKSCGCCKGKDCACCKSKECCKKSCKCCCAAKSKEAKKTVSSLIVVVMPGPMTPLCAACPPAPAYAFHHVPAASNGFAVVPHPLPPPPPMLTPPGIPVPTMVTPVMPPQTIGMPPPPPPPPTACCPCPPAGSSICGAPDGPVLTKANDGPSLDNCLSILGMVSDLCCAHLHPTSLPAMCLSSLGTLIDLCPQSADGPASYEPTPQQATLLPPPRPDATPCMPANVALPVPIVPCAIATPKPAAPAALKVCIVAQPYSDQLEMNVGDDTCVSCRKMTLTLGDSDIRLTRLDGRVRVRSEELKAKADCVRTDRKDRLILEGNVQLRYRTDEQHASIHADCIELDLAAGSVTIKPAAESTGSYAPERVHGGLAP